MHHLNLHQHQRKEAPNICFLVSEINEINDKHGHLEIKNNATVEMTIADFFHCKNIPDAVVEMSRFLWLVCVCHLVREDFAVPNQKRSGGELLDHKCLPAK